MYTVKWFVLQYVIIRPAVSIAGIIAQSYDVLCEAEGFNWRFASVWLSAIDFVSISVALYGLFMFYGLTAEELKDRRPLAKFLSIKLIVMFTFYQSFVFSAMEGRVIKATRYWTAANIADGLNALTICIEMVFFAILMWWAYTPAEYYRKEGAPATGIWRPLWDSINYADFALEIIGSFKFFIDYVLGKPSAHGHGQRSEEQDSQSPPKKNFAEAFGISSTRRAPSEVPISEEYITLDPKSSDREFTAL